MPSPPFPTGGRPSRSVAIRFRAGRAPEPSEQAEDRLTVPERAFWDAFEHEFGPARLHPVHHGGESGRAGALLARVRQRKPEFKPRIDVNAQFTVDLERQDRLEDATRFLRQWDALEHTTIRGSVSVPVSGATEPSFAAQTHLHRAPEGVTVEAVWAKGGGTGAGVQFADVEGGWDMTHPDLTQLPTTLVFGLAADARDKADESAEGLVEHGTAVMGLVAAAHNGSRCAGVVPDLGAVYLSAFRQRSERKGKTSWFDVTADAVIEAILTLRDGDILLIEAEEYVALDVTGQPIYKLPIEVRADLEWAIEAATILGITVVEPAGNGFNDLDRFLDENNVAVFDRDQTDSGAIMVGASSWNSATGEQDGCGMNNVGFWGTNYGARIDCFAAGDDVTTISAVSANGERSDFGGTSAASAIIAGTCAAIQGALRSAGQATLPPKDLRALLSDAALGTSPSAKWVGLIGVMPDLSKVLAKLGL
jgi:serine protease